MVECVEQEDFTYLEKSVSDLEIDVRELDRDIEFRIIKSLSEVLHRLMEIADKEPIQPYHLKLLIEELDA